MLLRDYAEFDDSILIEFVSLLLPHISVLSHTNNDILKKILICQQKRFDRTFYIYKFIKKDFRDNDNYSYIIELLEPFMAYTNNIHYIFKKIFIKQQEHYNNIFSLSKLLKNNFPQEFLPVIHYL